MNKILLISVICLLLISVISIKIIDNQKSNTQKEKVFYGPVQEGINQTYFWETGITKILGVDK